MAAVTGQAGGYFDGFEVAGDGQSTINITRRFVPQWAIVVAVIGALCFLLGLLALLCRQTETCTIQVWEVEGGTAVRIAGVTGAPLYNNLSMHLNSLRPPQ